MSGGRSVLLLLIGNRPLLGRDPRRTGAHNRERRGILGRYPEKLRVAQTVLRCADNFWRLVTHCISVFRGGELISYYLLKLSDCLDLWIKIH